MLFSKYDFYLHPSECISSTGKCFCDDMHMRSLDYCVVRGLYMHSES